MKNPLGKKMLWSLALAVLLLVGTSALGTAYARTGQAAPVKAAGDIKPPTVIKQVSPVYPEEARKKRVEGTVILEATTDVKGNVQNVKVLRSVPALDQAAMDAVKQWVYEPKIIDGKAVRITFTVTVRFVLDKEKEAAKKGAEAGEAKAGATSKEAAKPAGEGESPTRITKVDPVYPEEARKQGIEGSVILELTVDVKGKVQNVKVLTSVPALDQAAVDAVKQWVYEPKLVDGKPVPFVCTVTVRFALK